MANKRWPELLPADAATFATLHLWTQIVGKVRVALTPWINHSWHVPLYIAARGLSTSPIAHPNGCFEIEFDFVAGEVRVLKTTGEQRALALTAMPVATFHSALLGSLNDLELPVKIHGAPNELPDAVRFADDDVPRVYDPEAARCLWLALVSAHDVLTCFRSGFVGKVSPVHFFWGSFDLAVTRFSGRAAPLHPGGIPNLPDAITREAYSHEVSSAGFWPGDASTPPLFYSYAYPEPEGFSGSDAGPGHYDSNLHEFVLPYERVRTSSNPDATLLAFLDSTYAAAANLSHWDRQALDCPQGVPRKPRVLP